MASLDILLSRFVSELLYDKHYVFFVENHELIVTFIMCIQLPLMLQLHICFIHTKLDEHNMILTNKT